MKYTQNIGDIKIIIEDNRSERNRKENPIVFEVCDVKVTISKNDTPNNCKIKQKIKMKREDSRSPQPKKFRQHLELEINGALPTSRDDDFVLVKQLFLEEFECDFYWKEDDVYEFIGEHCNLYDDKAMRKFDRVTKYPAKCGYFWTAFYKNKVGNR